MSKRPKRFWWCQTDGCKVKEPSETFAVLTAPWWDPDSGPQPRYYCARHKRGKDYRGRKA